MQLPNGSERSHIVVTDNGTRSRVAVQKDVDGRAGALTLAIAVHYQFRHKRQPGALHRLPISGEALRVRLIAVAIAEVGDSFVTQLDQVIRHIRTCFNVFYQYRVDEFSRMLIVDQYD